MGEEKEAVKESEFNLLMDTISAGTEYACYPGVEFTRAKLRQASRGRIEYLVMGDAVSKADYYLLQAVYELRYASIPVLMEKIRLEQERNPDRDYSPIAEKGQLKKQLEFLSANGFLFYHEFMGRKGKKIRIYLCSNEGWRAYKCRLNVSSRYDLNAIYQPPYEVFRHLCANTVLYGLSGSGFCMSVTPVGEMTYTVDGLKRTAYLYGKASVNDGRNKARYIVEPVHYLQEEGLLSEKELSARIRNRLIQLEELVRYYDGREDGEKTYVIFEVENEMGLFRLKEQLEMFDLPFLTEKLFFTCERIVSHCKERKEIENSMLGLYSSEGRLYFEQRTLPTQLE